MLTPNYERKIFKNKKYNFVVGVDEVGRGCWAGPVVMVAVALERDRLKELKLLKRIRDSKKLDRLVREKILQDLFSEKALAEILRELRQKPTFEVGGYKICIAEKSAQFISEHGLAAALRSCLADLVSCFDSKDTFFLSDAGLNWKYQINSEKKQKRDFKYESFIGGDDKIYSIALASIIAKVYRDNYMLSLSKKYPQFGFETHVGYGTKKHREAISRHGIITEHRLSYKVFAKFREGEA